MNRKLIAEGLGTFFLLAALVGSGIMAERLAGSHNAVALLCNAIPTGAILVVLIMMFAPISGAHFNPAVTISFVLQKQIASKTAILYILVQIIGGIAGVMAVHIMFDNPLIDFSVTSRTGIGQWVGEFIATFGLVGVIIACSKHRPQSIAVAVGLYITSAYWFTSSTSFANPAVTIGRAFSDTFTGISPNDVIGFIIAQVIAAILVTPLFLWLFKD